MVWIDHTGLGGRFLVWGHWSTWADVYHGIISSIRWTVSSSVGTAVTQGDAYWTFAVCHPRDRKLRSIILRAPNLATFH